MDIRYFAVGILLMVIGIVLIVLSFRKVITSPTLQLITILFLGPVLVIGGGGIAFNGYLRKNSLKR